MADRAHGLAFALCRVSADLVIIILAYVVGVANLPHVIAGNVETFYLVSTGALSFGRCVTNYLLPTLIGNVIGGVALVAVGAHAEFYEVTGNTKS